MHVRPISSSPDAAYRQAHDEGQFYPVELSSSFALSLRLLSASHCLAELSSSFALSLRLLSASHCSADDPSTGGRL